MIQVYTDGALAYDSRLERYDLLGLKITTGLNVGGTAEITMPQGHPAYNSFVSQKTIVTVYRDGALRFRGRALYPAANYDRQQTIVCEGELCLLRDSINRPYLYQASPRSCFVTLINQHNAQVEEFKQFKVGEVTVVDANDYIRLESESAESTLDTLNKLLDRCGGYIVFTDAEDGSRVINWYATLDNRSGQVIEFGENLLDFASTGANTTGLATGLVPYGARNEETKKRVTIESVNGGKDYIIAEDAKAIRGTIYATATWDDVTEPANLLKKARAYLDEIKVFITSLELTALDLSYLNKDLDSFAVGDNIRVTSAPHGVNEDFQLSQLTEDLLNPANSRIILGKDIPSLTGADVAGDNKGQNAVEAAKSQYSQDIQKAASSIEQQVAQKMEQDLSAAISLLSGDFATIQALNNAIAARQALIDLIAGSLYIGGGLRPTFINGSEVHLGDEEHGTQIHSSGNVQFTAGATFQSGNADFANGAGIRIANKDGSVYYVLRVDASNNCFVGNDYCNLYLRGKDAVYLHKTGAAVTSDRRQKNSIEALPEAYTAMLDNLTPVRFRYNNRGGRYHVGFIAQDVDAALAAAGLTREDFGGFVDVAGDGSELGLAYDEFIGLLHQKNRQLEARLAALEKKLEKMEEKQ